MQDLWTGVFLGVSGGAVLSALVARWALRRYVTRLRAAERRARTAERLAEIGAMTGGLAHEIKNPLSTIGLNAQLLAEGVNDLPVDEAEKGRLIRRMDALRREVERLRGILQDFLEYAGEIRLDRRRENLNRIVEELVDFYVPQAEKSRVRVRTDLHPEALVADVDAAHLKQAVLNLMLNAVQAMAATGGELVLRTRRGLDPEGAPVAAIDVTDTGPGMDGATLEKIFRPYFTTKSGGTGLGLPTARRLIEAHEGRLEVESEPGKGTTFSIVLPGV